MSNLDGDNPDDLLQEGEDFDAGEDDTNISEELGEGDYPQQNSLADDSILLNENDDTTGVDDASFEQIKMRMKEFEEEASKLKKFNQDAEKKNDGAATSPAFLSPDEKKEIDARSIYVGNVDYGATAEELELHFHGCGAINRVTINCDKFSGHPKGFAYIEFTDPESLEPAQALDESLFRGRQIKVTSKRTNIPGHSTTNRPPRGRGRGGFRARGGFRGYRSRPSFRGAYRGRGRANYYYPY